MGSEFPSCQNNFSPLCLKDGSGIIGCPGLIGGCRGEKPIKSLFCDPRYIPLFWDAQSLWKDEGNKIHSYSVYISIFLLFYIIPSN